MQYTGGIHEYSGDTVSTPWGVQYTGAYHDECGEYHEYIGGVQYTGDIMSTLEGVQDTRGLS